jgi:hypothetical protein
MGTDKGGGVERLRCLSVTMKDPTIFAIVPPVILAVLLAVVVVGA